MKDLTYDIEAMFIDGETPLAIAVTLKIPLSLVKSTLESFGVDARDIQAEIPYYGA
jgi:hypothetical protein